MQIFELKKAGLSFHAIGAAVGITKQSAWESFWKVMREVQALTVEDAKDWRSLQLERLEQMHAGLWNRARGGDVQAVEQCRKLEQMESELTGSFSPTKTANTTPTGEPIHHTVEWVMVRPGEK